MSAPLMGPDAIASSPVVAVCVDNLRAAWLAEQAALVEEDRCDVAHLDACKVRRQAVLRRQQAEIDLRRCFIAEDYA